MESKELSKDFKSMVTSLEANLKNIADGEVVIAGTDEKPIVRDSEAIPIRHHYMDGVYVREMAMYKGMAVIGHIHKHLHMCFLLQGHVTVANEHETVDYVAPCYIVSTPGVKRVLYANEDSLWFNIHKNPEDLDDLDVLERQIVAISYEEYEEYLKQK